MEIIINNINGLVAAMNSVSKGVSKYEKVLIQSDGTVVGSNGFQLLISKNCVKPFEGKDLYINPFKILAKDLAKFDNHKLVSTDGMNFFLKMSSGEVEMSIPIISTVYEEGSLSNIVWKPLDIEFKDLTENVVSMIFMNLDISTIHKFMTTMKVKNRRTTAMIYSSAKGEATTQDEVHIYIKDSSGNVDTDTKLILMQ